jgi:hypothetical protein
VLRRSLLWWGLGHLALGDRRGWLLAVLEPFAVGALLLIAVQLIDGTRWLLVFPPLAAVLVVWMAQAVHAHRCALRLGARPGGEVQIALLIPLGVALLTAYWLIGGRHGSPSATVEEYVVAWMSGQPAAAAPLFAQPPAEAELTANWRAQSDYLVARISRAAATYGPASGLDPDSLFDNLRFDDPVTAADGSVQVVVDIVRRQRVETTLLGFVPTASQETVLVEQAGTILLRLQPRPAPDWLPVGWLDSSAWRIDEIDFPAAPVAHSQQLF